MKPFDPHKKSKSMRRFRPTRKPAGVFSIAVAFCDASLLSLAYFLALSPFVLQPGINIELPESAFTGGAKVGAMVLSITRGGWFYFNDDRLDEERLQSVLQQAAERHPDVPLIIEADKRVEHGAVVNAWNAAQAAGIRQVSIATGIAAMQEEGP